jgi:hypothetical protein
MKEMVTQADVLGVKAVSEHCILFSLSVMRVVSQNNYFMRGSWHSRYILNVHKEQGEHGH